ncbi:hypothetical protein BC939DRAFT_221860 [Gamsiella multidivaricata]|uniref:uncharacterized protein n=1 Tax=Gamsiella multidivaricata TaxID=101098 RepID=UPI00221F4392|nr:uncharacterized protein BC939DRAFT_221860 [Gamsiella multidivaricata]KAI7831174.1 hypothetical protein BC939DRAFT_221860 [Gamsiella multidivaricata]
MTDQDHHSDLFHSSVNRQVDGNDVDSSGNSSGGDDIWDDGDNVSYDRAIAEREWSRLHDTFGNTGYREGIEEGKEGTLQQGFNQGWSEGTQYGHELGRFRGLISSLLEYVQSSPSSSTLASANQSPLVSLKDKDVWVEKATALVKELVELDISNVFDKAFFDDGYKPSSSTSKSNKADSNIDGTLSGIDSGCCGGASSTSSGSRDSCCQNRTAVSSTADKDTSTSDAQAQASTEVGCCGSKQGGGLCVSKEHGSMDKEKNGSSGGKECSSQPEQVIDMYRSRIHDLLKEVNMESLLEGA